MTEKDIGYCVTFGPIEMVQWFLDHGVDPLKWTDEQGRTLLFEAGKPEIAELLIARGVKVDAKVKSGETALTWILQMNRDAAGKIIPVLLKHGADPNVRLKGGYTPLMMAQDGASVDALVAGGADLNATDDRGEGVFNSGWGAAIPSRMEALRRHGLKLDPEKGASLLTEGRPSGTPLTAAIGNGYFDIAAILRTAGAKDVGLLSEAAAKGDLAQMTKLLDAGANVDERSGNGETPLHFAISQGQSKAALLLLQRGANVNLFSVMGYTARAMAQDFGLTAERQNFSQIHRLKPPEVKATMDEILQAILAHKPDPNFRNEAGETALLCSAGIGSLTDLSEKVDINAQRPDGMTALMIAIATQPKNAPKEGPGTVGITDEKSGETQRMSARAFLVKILLERGADLTLRNQAGKTALDLARENGNAEILALMEAFDAKK